MAFTEEDGLEAMTKGRLVTIYRLGRPEEPYVGILRRRLSKDMFWFEGWSGSEFRDGVIFLREILSIVERKAKKAGRVSRV